MYKKVILGLFVRNEKGATVAEYAIIAGLIAVVIGVSTLAISVNNLFLRSLAGW